MSACREIQLHEMNRQCFDPLLSHQDRWHRRQHITHRFFVCKNHRKPCPTALTNGQSSSIDAGEERAEVTQRKERNGNNEQIFNFPKRIKVAVDLNYENPDSRGVQSVAKQLTELIRLQKKYKSSKYPIPDSQLLHNSSDNESEDLNNTSFDHTIHQNGSTCRSSDLSLYPADLYFVGLRGELLNRCQLFGSDNWDKSLVSVSDKRTVCEALFDSDGSKIHQNNGERHGSNKKVNERLIYLSPDASEDLDTYLNAKKYVDIDICDNQQSQSSGSNSTSIKRNEGDGGDVEVDSCVFVLSGIVDLNATPRVSLSRAEALNARAYRLPIRKYLPQCKDTVLAINHCFETLILVHLGWTWRESLMEAMPKRQIMQTPSRRRSNRLGRPNRFAKSDSKG